MTIGHNIKRLRIAKGLSLSQMSLLMEYETTRAGATIISRWENDVRKPTLKSMERIAKALNIDIVELLKK